MNKPSNPVATETGSRLTTHEPDDELNHVPNFVHVGENPFALEGYLRLYVRELAECARRNH